MKKIFDKNDVKMLMEGLDNAQDQFIVLALFNGIMGDDMQELRELKVDDIDFEKSIIKVNDRIVKMDADFARVAKEAIQQKTYYYKHSDSIHATEDYLINTDSKYVLRVKPTKKNCEGTTPISYGGLRTRLRNLNLGISSRDLVDSGLVYKLLQIQPSYTVAEVGETLKKFNYNMNAYRIYKLMKDNFQI